jgi:hypothetical protein
MKHSLQPIELPFGTVLTNFGDYCLLSKLLKTIKIVFFSIYFFFPIFFLTQISLSTTPLEKDKILKI